VLKTFMNYGMKLLKHIDINVFFYLSGRSPLLYYIGEGRFRDKGITSPTLCKIVWLMIDILKEEHIETLLKIHKLPSNNKLTELIFRRTYGVPRLVEYVIIGLIYILVF